MTTTQRVTALVADEFGLDDSEVKADSKLRSLATDSLELLNLSLELEEEFGIDISDEDMHRFSTVGDVISYLEKR